MMREKTMMRERRLVYVSGAPGAGKTSLAGPLAAALGYALLTKDAITETLPIEAMAEFDVPVGIGALITVDTTAPVDVAAVAAEVRAYHALG
jgi:chloramphenicol 3-O-phosphotransferase